jgi:hypothetical protein
MFNWHIWYEKITITKLSLLFMWNSNCNGWCEESVRGPWGNGGHLGSRGSRGNWPARRGKGQTDGIRQRRRIDSTKMPQKTGKKLATTPSHVYAQRMYHCALCINYRINIITGIVFYCIICFRRINHLVIKNHLHSFSGVREVVSSTVTSNE